MSEKEQPGLGAFSAPVEFIVKVGSQWYEFCSPALTLTPSGSEQVRSVSGVGSFLPLGVPPPVPVPPVPPVPTPTPPPAPALVTKVTLTLAGDTMINGVVTLDGRGAPEAGQVGLKSDFAALLMDERLPFSAGATRLTFQATAPEVQVPTPVRVTATLGISRATGSVTLQPRIHPVPTPSPPGPLRNVRNDGAKGDGVTDEAPVLNAVISKAAPGTTLYFPAGTYAIGDALKVLRPDLSFLGDGDASIIKITGNSHHVQIGSGQPFTGFSFKKLHFYGTPGKYMQDGTSHGGVLNFGSRGTVFEDCLWTGCAEPVLNAGTAGSTYGTIIKNCRILGWGRMAIFCNGGERVSGCHLIQDDPNLMGERSSHGFYIHGGCKDVEIADTEIVNARKYALQVYSEQAGTKTVDVRLLRLTIRNCANGIILAHSQMGAGDIGDCVIEGCRISGVYAGSSLAIKDGAGVIIRNNVIDGNTGAAAGHSGAGIYLGVWAPYEPGFSLQDVKVISNTVRGCDRGIWTLPSNGGKFTNVQITGNIVSGNRQNYDITGPGVIWTPQDPQSAFSHPDTWKDAQHDSRPSDDRSPAARERVAGVAG